MSENNRSSLWLRFFPPNYPNDQTYWGADYSDLIRSARSELNKDELALLLCNDTTTIISIIGLLSNNPQSERNIDNFCTIPRQSLQSTQSPDTHQWLIKSFSACDEISEYFSNSLMKNPDSLEKKEEIKFLLGEHTCSISPPKESVAFPLPQEKVYAHHEFINQYLDQHEINHTEVNKIICDETTVNSE